MTVEKDKIIFVPSHLKGFLSDKAMSKILELAAIPMMKTMTVTNTTSLEEIAAGSKATLKVSGHLVRDRQEYYYEYSVTGVKISITGK